MSALCFLLQKRPLAAHCSRRLQFYAAVRSLRCGLPRFLTAYTAPQRQSGADSAEASEQVFIPADERNVLEIFLERQRPYGHAGLHGVKVSVIVMRLADGQGIDEISPFFRFGLRAISHARQRYCVDRAGYILFFPNQPHSTVWYLARSLR